jgi:RHS repeat-associated protein
VTLYPGRELDSETGLYYYRNRYYSTELGRFVSRDPIGYQPGDGSLYCFRGSAPTVYLDPSGLTVEVLPPEILGVDTFDTWMRRPLLLGTQKATFGWRDREPISARVLISLPVPFFVCKTCELFLASCTVDRKAVGVTQIFYYKVVRDRLPLQFRGLVDELNAQVEWEETAHEAALLFWITDYSVTGYGVGCDDLLARVNACEAARALQRTIEGSRIAALAATNALIDAIGYQQRLNIRRRAFELAGRLQ